MSFQESKYPFNKLSNPQKNIKKPTTVSTVKNHPQTKKLKKPKNSRKKTKLLSKKIANLFEIQEIKNNEQAKNENLLQEAPSAKGLEYTLVMSSKYINISNTFEGLQLDDGSKGAATQKMLDNYIEAQFPYRVRVSKITVREPRMHGFCRIHLNGMYIQFSNDRCVWEDVLKVEGIYFGVKHFEIVPVVAQYWRIFNKDNLNVGYMATGTLRFE